MATKRRRKAPAARGPEAKRHRKASTARKADTKRRRRKQPATRTTEAMPRRRSAIPAESIVARGAPHAESIVARGAPAAEAVPADDLASLKRSAQASFRALLRIEAEVPEADRQRYLEARAQAREARDALELAEFERLVREQEQALPELAQRTKRLAADLQGANDAVAAVNIAAAGLELFADVVRLFAKV